MKAQLNDVKRLNTRAILSEFYIINVDIMDILDGSIMQEPGITLSNK